MKNENVSILFNKSFTLDSFEISHIEYSHEYNFIESLFSTLFEYDKSGNITGGIAKKHWWEGQDLHIILRNDVKSTRGDKITSSDVKRSLLRAIEKNATTHGKLQSFLSKGRSHDESIQIISEDKLVLKMGKETDEAITLLANPEWSIIPEKSLKHPKWTIDFNNTSGAFYIEKEIEDGYILKPNIGHYRHSNKGPKQITLKYLGYDSEKLFAAVEDGSIDVIPTYYGLDTVATLDRFASKNNYNVHITQNILLDFVQFTRRGLREIPRERRIAIGKKIRENFEQRRTRKEVTPTLSFFSAMGESTLSEEEAKDVNNKFSEINHTEETGKGIILQTNFKEFETKQKERYKAELPDLDVKMMPLSELLYNKEMKETKETPHIVVFNIDSGFNDDLSLIAYSVSTGVFDVLENKQAWYENYLSLDKLARRKELNNAHLKILKEASIIPIQSSPYAAVLRSPWKLNYTTLSAGTPFWAIEHE